jgi:transposase InsO family protein
MSDSTKQSQTEAKTDVAGAATPDVNEPTSDPESAEPGLVNDGEIGVEPLAENFRPPALTGRRSGPALRKTPAPKASFTAEQRLLILDTFMRSGLAAGDFAPLVGMSKHTLWAWKKKFDEHGPAGLMEQKRGAKSGSKLPELTKRTILMIKQANPEFGCERISDLLARGPALPASAGAVARVLREAGYESEDVPTNPHPDKVRRFERATPNQLWQTDIFTFVLKRQNRRVFLVGFMDDHSRFIVGYGLHATASTALVLEALRAAMTSFGNPEEVLTDNGSQYITWRGKSSFTKELEQRGVKQVVARPRHPETLGKIERFWATLWRECLETAVFMDLEDARRRIGHFIDYYNFRRPHQGLEGATPAERFFGVASQALESLKMRVAENALELARTGTPKQPFFLTGQTGGKTFSIHTEGERVFITQPGQERREVDLSAVPVATEGSPATKLPAPSEQAPGASPLDAGLRTLAALLKPDGDK